MRSGVNHFFYFKENIIAHPKYDRRKPRAEHLVNEKIPFSKMFVVGTEGEKLGVKSKYDALKLAEAADLDLVVISNNPKSPVAKLLDYGKFKYERKKKAKENKAKQSITENRTVRLTPMIGDHDLKFKVKKAREFINNGDRVKVSLKFRGREMARKDLGYDKLKQFAEMLSDVAIVQKQPLLTSGRFLDMFLIRGTSKKIQPKKDLNKEADNAKDEN